MGSYFPVNSRSYTEQYNSAYQSYEEALNDYKNQMEEYEKDPSKFDSKPVEPTFEGMFPGFQSPKDRFVDVNTQNNARNMYLAVANGDVSIEDFVPDCEPYGTDIKDIWSAGSLFSTEFLSPEVKSKYNLTMGMEQILSKPAVNYTAEEIKANNIQPVTYESFTEAIIKGMEYTNSILTEYATRYDNVQEIQINLNTQAKNDTIWDYIKNAYAYSIEVNNDLSFNSIYVSPEDLERQAIRNEEYFGKQFALLEQIEAFNSANVALNKSQTNNKLVMNSLNEKWKWILP